jgi:hypothetical protein
MPNPKLPAYVYHGTSRANAENIKRLGVRMDKSGQGYFGTAFYVTPDESLARSNYAGTDGVVLKFKLDPRAMIIDLTNSSGFALWKTSGLDKEIWRPDFDAQARKFGIQGVIDPSMLGMAIYDAKVLTLVDKNPIGQSTPPIPDIRFRPTPSGSKLLTPSARRPGKFQVTDFLADGTPAGHDEFDSLAEAIAENFFELDHPLARLASQSQVAHAWEEATFEHPYADELADQPYAYVSPLRPLSGIDVEGRTSYDKSGRIGVLYRDKPLSIESLIHLNLVPATEAAILVASQEIAVFGTP